MAPKRAAASAASPGKGRKAAKVTPVDPIAQGIDEVVGALVEVASLTPSCREMAAAMVPYCLGRPRPERHEFQANFAQELVQLFRGEQAAREAAVKDVEAEQAVLKEEEEGAGAKLEAARGASAAANAKKAEARAALAAAQAATGAAKAGLAAAQKSREDAAAGAGELRGRLAAAEATLAQCWEPLLAEAFAGRGGWRKRDKAIHEVQEALRGVGAPASLIEGAAAAFKTKVEARGPFAAKALEFAKKSLDDEIAAIKAKIAGAEEQDSTLAAGIQEAEAAVAAAEASEAALLEACMAAENAWAEAESAVNDLKDPSFGPRSAALERKLASTKATLQEMVAFVEKVCELEQRERPAEPKAEGEAEAGAAAAEEAGAAAPEEGA